MSLIFTCPSSVVSCQQRLTVSQTQEMYLVQRMNSNGLGLMKLCFYSQDYLTHTVRPFANDRPVYLLGESFGGLLALAVAKKCQ